MLYNQVTQEFENLEFFAKQVVEGFITGLHKSPFHGFSVEFAEHRLYNKGESTKNIDWKLFARTDKLFVKRYDEETNLRCQLVIDHSSSMFFPERKKFSYTNPNKIQFSIQAAAALSFLLKKQRDAVGLSVFSEEIDIHTPAKSSGLHHRYILHELDKLGQNALTQQKSFTVDALHNIADKIHQRSLVILFTDMFDTSEKGEKDLFEALQHLRYNKHEVVLFHVLEEASETNLDFENRLHKFVDLESGETIKLNPFQIKEAFQVTAKGFQRNLKLKCAANKIDYVPVDIAKGFAPILSEYLIKRKSML
jgi:uncharacterized protein (DUF58 family)